MIYTDDTSLTHSTRPFKSSAGFSLVELLVTLSIIALLFSVMLPTLRGVRGVAEKLMCANNMRSIYYGLNGYANDSQRLQLPYCYNHNEKLFQETMSLTANDPNSPGLAQWDGLGLLWRNNKASAYLDNCKCLFCPSHHGAHGYENYRAILNNQSPNNLALLDVPSNDYASSPKTISKIYSNYQYAGGYHPITKSSVSLFNNPDVVLLSDGMRTFEDFNHTIGGNVLRGSGEIGWFSYSKLRGKKMSNLPMREIPHDEQEKLFGSIWASLQTETGN